ncbi:MAG: hypothetical protein HFJ35_04325 [Clostridia bacterium]|nr:hypothetical protein [Clostridia bacterium]
MVFGINTEQEVFEEEISNIATSIKKEFKIEVKRNQVIAEFCNLFEDRLMDRISS